MTGLDDEAVIEGHDLIDAAEHEAQASNPADPRDFKTVHHVGESGGSILPDKPSASSASGTAGGTLESKIQEIREKIHLK